MLNAILIYPTVVSRIVYVPETRSRMSAILYEDEEESVDSWAAPNMRDVSSSYVCPRPWEWDKYAPTPSGKQGYLEKQSVKDKTKWKRRWVVMNSSVLRFYKSQDQAQAQPSNVDEPSLMASLSSPPMRQILPEEATTSRKGCIQLDCMGSVGTAKDCGSAAFQIKLHTEGRKYVFRADTKDHVRSSNC